MDDNWYEQLKKYLMECRKEMPEVEAECILIDFLDELRNYMDYICDKGIEEINKYGEDKKNSKRITNRFIRFGNLVKQFHEIAKDFIKEEKENENG